MNMNRMKKILLAMALIASLPAFGVRAEELLSPSGNMKLDFRLVEGGTPVYSLSYKGEPVIAESRLGFRLDNSGLFDWFEIADVERSEYDGTWSPAMSDLGSGMNFLHRTISYIS